MRHQRNNRLGTCRKRGRYPVKRSAMTLLEVVAAAALLAAVVAATLPFLLPARGTAPSREDLDALIMIVDQSVSSWRTSGDIPDVITGVDPSGIIAVRVLDPDVHEAFGRWVIFSRGEISIARWVPAATPVQGDTP